jgi:hypothetical protein
MLENKIFTKNDKNLNEFLRFVRAKYNYTEEIAAERDEVSAAITSAFDLVSGGLIEFSIDNPDATSLQIKTEGNRLIQEQAEAFAATKREGYLKYLDYTGDGAIPIAFPIDPANPVQSINNFLSSGVVLREEQRQILLGRIRVLNSPRFKEQWQQ